jgi:hypothetical protein
MTLNDKSTQRLDPERGQRPARGWTQIHSWVFLAIVAIGLAVIVAENRYHYLSPLGLGKAYRIDKLFGGIQEFHPTNGWIAAQLASGPPSRQASVPGLPPSAGSQAVPMNMPAPSPATSPAPSPGEVVPPSAAQPSPSEATTPKVLKETPGQPAPPKERVAAAVTPEKQGAPVEETPAAAEAPSPMSRDERLRAFKQQYPDYGEEEFQLANDDLFPDWKKKVAPNGTWPEFLKVYHEFVQWWADSGSPPEPGFQLWQKFLASKAQKR